MAAERFLLHLREIRYDSYEKLLEEIEKYSKALKLVQSDDTELIKALDVIQAECVSEICENTKKRKRQTNQSTARKRTKLDRGTKRFYCYCGKSYSYRQGLHKHKKKCATSQKHTFRCTYCEIPFNDYSLLVNHLEENHPLVQSGMGNVSTPRVSTARPLSPTVSLSMIQPPYRRQSEPPPDRQSMPPPDRQSVPPPDRQSVPPPDRQSVPPPGKYPSEQGRRKLKTTSALNNSVQNVVISPTNEEKRDLILFFAKVKTQVQDILDRRRQERRNIKFYLNTRVKMVRNIELEGESETVPHFRSKTKIALRDENLDHDLNSAFQQMSNSMEEFINKGSDWKFDEVTSMEVVTVPYGPLGGSSYLPLPPKFQGIRSIVNVKNNDQKCFLWSVIAACHPASHNAERISHYLDYENDLNMTGIEFPVTLNNIPKFEKQNSISINVFGMEGDKIFPMYLSKLDISQVEVDLLYLRNEENSHYCLIKDLNKFLGITKKAKIKHYFCRRCLHGFIRADLLHEHQSFCKQFEFQRVKYPKEGYDDILEFQNFHKQLRVPFVIYADFETLVEKMDTCSPNPAESSTTKCSHFEPCGYAYKVVCSNDNHTKSPVVYRGEGAVQHFLKKLHDEEQYIKDILSKDEPLIMNDHTERAFQLANECHICKKPFDSKSIKVRDHYHIGVTGDINSSNYSNYRGAACQHCNLNFSEPKFIPVIFHNLRGFDGHLLCQAIGKYKDEEIKCIAQNMNRYLSISLGDMRFIDSFQFMSESLEKLVDNLVEEGGSKPFKHFRNMYQDENTVNLLLRKNVYCYDYFDSFDKFNEDKLPAKEAFYNRLSGQHISDEDYDQVQKVWATLGMQTLGDLHDNYVITDVLLLADVFEKFRDMTIDHYGLDACHYFTAPGLAWDSALKMTDIRLDLLTDPIMYNFFETGLRGGVSMISKRSSDANNPYLENYDVKKATQYLMYLDANNLYGGVMRMPLPIGMMRWMTKEEIYSFDINSIPIDGATGYTLEVDLEYPDKLHDLHNCYPLAPEHKTVIEEEVSPYNKHLWKDIYHQNQTDQDGTNAYKFSKSSCKKLIPTLENKTNYIVHYRNLQLYIKLGLKLTKIHRILEYRQKPWLRPYIDFNSDKRKQAKSDFEKDFFKLMNNAVFGKTMENLRNRVDIKLIQNEQKLKKYCSKPSFQRVQIFNEDLVGVENSKVTLLLNKPVYVGQTVLDLAKLVMYDFHYNFMKQKYGEKVKLLFTDTDSLMYEIQTEDVYKDMGSYQQMYDLSNYPSDHPLHSDVNKKVVLKMKDECAGTPVVSFVGLRSKMYSILLADNSEKRAAKGISKSVIKKDLNHKLYKKILLEKSKTLNEMISIRSDHHELFIEKINKTGLCGYDDKRYVKECGIESYAYGHYFVRDHTNRRILEKLEN
ncbi:hypothetical protein FSP39_016361 [Pinctada imbricata]|uniref:C2H2-type domain-containing protein n=1 Tax=Pinctada imbricata TaxID=66713 RepID=A0AA89BS54_PINIB|nr:hypothetical protein FSP39_016361 [Pinctada imbricata]